MPKTSDIIHYMLNPQQLRAIIQWKLYRDPMAKRNPDKESKELKRCYDFLDLTSRSFSTVIKELTDEMRVPVSLFYLVLRGLDTIEDDMTIPLETKEPLLRNFHEKLYEKGWNYDGCGPNEKDRQLLVEFEVVVEEFGNISQGYQDVIKDITKKMGNGMADYARQPEFAVSGVKTIEDYDQYCWYVAGLVGEGLTRLFVPAGVANPALLERPNLHSAMGLFLQKTNIIRDYREDLDDKRSFWPREIWKKYVDNYSDLGDPKFKEAALNCQSEMILNALNHITECLFYLAGIKEQSVFNFCAIPQVMAIATLALCYRNYDMFQKNVKIPKGEACHLMMEMGNMRTTCQVFKGYLDIIHKKATPKDPNFLNISISCARVDQFVEQIFPSDYARELDAKRDTEIRKIRRDDRPSSGEAIMLLIVAGATFSVMTLVMCAVAYFLGARFDLAAKDVSDTFQHYFNISIPLLTDMVKNVSRGDIPRPSPIEHVEL